MARTVASMKRMKAAPCLGSTVHRASAYARTKGGEFKEEGHLLNVSYPMGIKEKEGIVWCARCGAYGEKAARG